MTTDQSWQSLKTDVLVLGGGIAGFRAAVAARQAGHEVTIAFAAQGASPYIIGANIPLDTDGNGDSPEVYFADMINGGYELNDRRLVQALAENAIPSFNELVNWGVPFAAEDGKFLQRHLSGNTFPRSVYVAEGTGRAILAALKKKANELGVQVLQGWKVVSLATDRGEVVGAVLANRHKEMVATAKARATVLAMGGVGRIFDESTYPVDVAADSYALAYQAGAKLIDMEFVQFEPVVTVWPQQCAGMEMPTAMFGDGAQLLNAKGERFMSRYNPDHAEKRIEKARMSLCIQKEIDDGRGLSDGTVYFDATLLESGKLEGYVTHCKRLRAAGVEPATQAVRVRPAAHSEMGGVFVDQQGWSGVPGLFVCGEASGGVHGASRIAGNGGAETVVLGALAGRGAARNLLSDADRDWAAIQRMQQESFFDTGAESGATADEIKACVRKTMKSEAGIYRSETGLQSGLATVEHLPRAFGNGTRANCFADRVAALEAHNVVLVARMILKAALARKESRGAHQRRDYPASLETGELHHLMFCQDNGADLSVRPIAIH